ncbi:hypothetical protein DSO57_1006212 [Entomophthora muscae]|uniref:Uncharacterized protein n=1 Tax=Entomophthora muscae TaxID=34485 RepID=A0ACC2S9V3_9FUNG|nr:hypothetical protein DSO57_1006212 [Entomophthora muscae]
MKATLGSKIPPSQAMAATVLAWLRKVSTQYQQLWAIHGQFNEHTIPFVFFFLPNKREETYIHTFDIIKQKLDTILPTLEEETTDKRSRKKKVSPEATQE